MVLESICGQFRGRSFGLISWMEEAGRSNVGPTAQRPRRAREQIAFPPAHGTISHLKRARLLGWNMLKEAQFRFAGMGIRPSSFVVMDRAGHKIIIKCAVM